jgi:hypothetical protein
MPPAPAILKATDYAVVGDGTTDDTAAMQALFDAAEALSSCVIFLNIAGDIKLTSTLVLNDTTTATYVSIEGLSEAKTRLKWAGSTSGICLKISKNKYFVCARFGVYNAVAKGTTIGIDLTGPADVGTQTHLGTFDHVVATGFNVGIHAGHYTNFATSEMVYRHLSLESCSTGWKNGSLNSLNHQFEMLLTNGCDIGLDISSGNAYVNGGGSNNNIKDFKISNTGMTVEIKNFRSEAGASRTRFLEQTASGFQVIRIVGCMVVGKGADSGIAVSLGFGGNVSFLDNTIEGKVTIASQATYSTLTMSRNYIFGGIANYDISGAFTSGIKLPFFVTDVNGTARTRLFLQGNVFHDIDAGTPDFTYPDLLGGNFQGAGVLFPGLVRTADEAPSDVMRLMGVVQLSQAPYPATGKNLRLTTKFAGSGTLAVTFIRDVTVTTTASVSYVDSSAAFYPTDVGRKIVIDNADGAGGTQVGILTHFDTASRLYGIKASGVNQTNGSGRTAHIGEVEPNANYVVFVQGKLNETYEVSAKTATGFTLTSSNGSSTAVVDLLIVR